MKKLFILPLLCLFSLGACEKENTQGGIDEHPIQIDESALPIIFSEASGYKQIRFIAPEAWQASVSENEGDWCQISPTEGEAGPALLTIQTRLNSRYVNRSTTIVLQSGEATRQIEVKQVSRENLVIESSLDLVSPQESERSISVVSNVVVHAHALTSSQEWIRCVGQTRTPADDGRTRYTFLYHISQNNSTNDRSTLLTFTGNIQTKEISLKQAGRSNDTFYESTDFSADGTVTTLQQATEGAGIDIVLMGDAFSDRQHADGTYLKQMTELSEMLFSYEPFRSLRHLFNVYTVAVVSKNQAYVEGLTTALGTHFTSELAVSGDHDQCRNYALKVPGMTSERLTNTVIAVMMNTPVHAGTTFWWLPENSTNYGCGSSIAYFAMDTSPKARATLAVHEAMGHGFAKLADEYTTAGNEHIPKDKIAGARLCENAGWFKNIDFTNNSTKVKWHRLLADKRYQGTGLYIFEGGYTYKSGVFRPTAESIMNTTEVFNAPSREAIYYRIHKLAYGNSWRYDYETFVAYDLAHPDEESSARAIEALPAPEPTPPPRFVDDLF